MPESPIVSADGPCRLGAGGQVKVNAVESIWPPRGPPRGSAAGVGGHLFSSAPDRIMAGGTACPFVAAGTRFFHPERLTRCGDDRAVEEGDRGAKPPESEPAKSVPIVRFGYGVRFVLRMRVVLERGKRTFSTSPDRTSMKLGPGRITHNSPVLDGRPVVWLLVHRPSGVRSVTHAPADRASATVGQSKSKLRTG